MSDHQVVWNGDRRGPYAGHLIYDPTVLERSALEREIAQLPPLPLTGFSSAAVRQALQRHPKGVMLHELASELLVESHRVNGVLYGLVRTGQVRAERLEESVWTGRRWAWHRYFWIG